MVSVVERKDRNIIQPKVMLKDTQKSQISQRVKKILVTTIKQTINVLQTRTSLKNVKLLFNFF